jgi:hypothetical protein
MSKGKEEFIESTLNQYLEQENAHEISLSDIVDSPEYRELCPTPESCNYEDLKGLLYTFGMDNQFPIQEQHLSHRNWKGVVVTCPRWVGVKRKDHQWVNFMNSVNKFQNN